MTLEDYMKENYGNEKAIDIAKKFNKSVCAIYSIASRLKIKTNKSQNKTFEINELMHQVFLSGFFGDGSFRKMGLGVVYREKHALDEEEYCLWKHKLLTNMTNLNKLYYYKDAYVNFDTSNTKQLLWYKESTVEEKIEQLDELGLLLYFLDDGWTCKKAHCYGGNISTVKLSVQQLKLIAVKYSDLCSCIVNVKTWSERDGKCPNVLYIPDVSKLVELSKKYGLYDLDIGIKKFQK